MASIDYDPNDPFLKRFSTQGKPVNPAVPSTDPFVRKVVDASRARAQAAKAPAAVSAPVSDNPAPVATSRAASTPSFGQRVLGSVKGFVRGLGGAAIVGAGAGAAANTIMNDPAANMSPDETRVAGRATVDMAGDVASKFGVVPTILSSVARAAVPDSLYERVGEAQARGTDFLKRFATGDVIPSAPVASPVGPVVPAPGGVATAEDVNVEPVGQQPEAPDAPLIPFGPQFVGSASAPLPPRPVLSKEGGIFSALADYQGQLSNYALAANERKFDRSATNAAATINNRASALYNEEFGRGQQRILDERKVAAVEADKEARARIDAATKGREVVQSPTGEIVIVNKATGTAQKVEPTTKPSLQQFRDAAKKDPRNKGATDADFDRYYKQTYGGK